MHVEWRPTYPGWCVDWSHCAQISHGELDALLFQVVVNLLDLLQFRDTFKSICPGLKERDTHWQQTVQLGMYPLRPTFRNVIWMRKQTYDLATELHETCTVEYCYIYIDFYSGNLQAFPGLRPVDFILRVFSTGSLEYMVKNTLVVLLSLDSTRPFRLDQPVWGWGFSPGQSVVDHSLGRWSWSILRGNPLLPFEYEIAFRSSSRMFPRPWDWNHMEISV